VLLCAHALPPAAPIRNPCPHGRKAQYTHGGATSGDRTGMTDIFFSYSSKDRDRVRPIRDALAAQGFEVFWDQEVPTGLDWDRWIRDHLNKAKCALVFWSINSIGSDNVRH